MSEEKELDPNDLLPSPEALKEQENLKRIYAEAEKGCGAAITAQQTDPNLPGFVKLIAVVPDERPRPIR